MRPRNLDTVIFCQFRKFRKFSYSKQILTLTTLRNWFFCFIRENAELVGDLLVFEKRAMSAPQAVALYNEKRMELTKMLETGAVSTESDEDAIMSSELVGADAILADVRVSALQALLGEIMSRLEREEGDGMRFLSQFQDAAKSEFGDLYPNLKFEVQR